MLKTFVPGRGISYFKGDATAPQLYVNKHHYILHVCNDEGLWGAGFVKSISKKWPLVEKHYRDEHFKLNSLLYPLGTVQFVKVQFDITVVNMIAQRGIGIKYGQIPLSYSALELCLGRLCNEKDAVFIGPKFGAGLAGGDWNVISDIIGKTIGDIDIYEQN